MSKNLYVFDLDHTLIDGDTSTMWCEYMVTHDLVTDKDAFLAREKELMNQYAQGTMKVEDYIAFSTEPISAMTCDEVDARIKQYVKEEVEHRFFAEALELIAKLKAANERILVISASADLIVKPVTDALGISREDVIAVEVLKENNHYKPQIVGTPSFKEGKVECLRRWQLLHPEYDGDIAFYTDSINDLPLCLEAQDVFAVNPNELFLKEAQSRNFTILKWQNAYA